MTSLSSAPGHLGAIQTEARAALETAIGTTRRNIRGFGDAYPDDTTDGGVYPLRPASRVFMRSARGAAGGCESRRRRVRRLRRRCRRHAR